MNAKVLAIYITSAAGSPLDSIEEAQLVAGHGIVGDRYYSNIGTFSKKLADLPDTEVTLIESEEIDHFNETQGHTLDYGQLRRNIVTKGIRLNDLVDKEFRIGHVGLKGIRLCEPCAYLSKLTTPDVLPGLVHRAGLRAAILQSGTIKPGDSLIVNQSDCPA